METAKLSSRLASRYLAPKTVLLSGDSLRLLFGDLEIVGQIVLIQLQESDRILKLFTPRVDEETRRQKRIEGPR